MLQVRRLLSLFILIFPLIALSRGEPQYYCQPGDTHYRAIDLDTLLGLVRIALFEKEAPATTENFIYYVNQGFYDNTVVHEIQHQYILQAGVYGTDSLPKTPLREAIQNESQNQIKHKAMRVAMWREASPETATSSFFINLKDNPNLNMPHGYTVFGEVIKGKDRVKRMQYQFSCHKIPTENPNCHPIVIHSAKLVELPCGKGS